MTDSDYIVYNLPEDKEPAKKAEKKNNAPKSVSKNPKKVNAFTQILNGDFLTKEFFLNNCNILTPYF